MQESCIFPTLGRPIPAWREELWSGPVFNQGARLGPELGTEQPVQGERDPMGGGRRRLTPRAQPLSGRANWDSGARVQPYFSGIRVLGSQARTHSSRPLESRSPHSHSCRRQSSWDPSDRVDMCCRSGCLWVRSRLPSVVRGVRAEERREAVDNAV